MSVVLGKCCERLVCIISYTNDHIKFCCIVLICWARLNQDQHVNTLRELKRTKVRENKKCSFYCNEMQHLKGQIK